MLLSLITEGVKGERCITYFMNYSKLLSAKHRFNVHYFFPFLLSVKRISPWCHFNAFLCHSAFCINTVCPPWVARSGQCQCFSLTEVVLTVHRASLCLPFPQMYRWACCPCWWPPVVWLFSASPSLCHGSCAGCHWVAASSQMSSRGRTSWEGTNSLS